MQKPKYTINEIKYAHSPVMYERAKGLYQTGKVMEITERQHSYAATIQGTHPYAVSVSKSHVDKGDCTCYMGKNEMLCKHMLALALAVLHASGKIEETTPNTNTSSDLNDVKPVVTAGFAKLRPYRGSSRIWFGYQRELATGAGIIAEAVSTLPPTKENANYLWNVIGRIDRKLINGVDDFDGVVGDCAARIIDQLAKYANIAPELEPVIEKYCNKKTNFCFEEELRDSLAMNLDPPTV